MVTCLIVMKLPIISNSFSQLSKEDEDVAGNEVEVRREDQDKINRFSRLHQRELTIQEELKTKNVRVSSGLQEQFDNAKQVPEREGRAGRHHDGTRTCRRGR